MFVLIKKILKKLITTFKPLIESIIEIECTIAKHWVSSAHCHLMYVQWTFPPQPEFFDHDIDLFYQWLKKRNSLWLERGCFGALALKGESVLELACGDGFNAKNFYSLQSSHVIAVDFDPKAIKTAMRKNSAPNIEFLLADIRTNMPEGKFENIIWDGAIEHFNPVEIAEIIDNIKTRLHEEGILSGYTIVERSDGKKSLSHHEYEFKNKEDLLSILSPHFKNVTVFETIYPSRQNLYFYASDGMLPLNNDWDKMITYRGG